jgi:CcmD family protein
VDTTNFLYMFYGFTVAWLVLFAYVVVLARREGQLKKDVESLKRMIEERERK